MKLKNNKTAKLKYNKKKTLNKIKKINLSKNKNNKHRRKLSKRLIKNENISKGGDFGAFSLPFFAAATKGISSALVAKSAIAGALATKAIGAKTTIVTASAAAVGAMGATHANAAIAASIHNLHLFIAAKKFAALTPIKGHGLYHALGGGLDQVSYTKNFLHSHIILQNALVSSQPTSSSVSYISKVGEYISQNFITDAKYAAYGIGAYMAQKMCGFNIISTIISQCISSKIGPGLDVITNPDNFIVPFIIFAHTLHDLFEEKYNSTFSKIVSPLSKKTELINKSDAFAKQAKENLEKKNLPEGFGKTIVVYGADVLKKINIFTRDIKKFLSTFQMGLTKLLENIDYHLSDHEGLPEYKVEKDNNNKIPRHALPPHASHYHPDYDAEQYNIGDHVKNIQRRIEDMINSQDPNQYKSIRIVFEIIQYYLHKKIDFLIEKKKTNQQKLFNTKLNNIDAITQFDIDQNINIIYRLHNQLFEIKQHIKKLLNNNVPDEPSLKEKIDNFINQIISALQFTKQSALLGTNATNFMGSISLFNDRYGYDEVHTYGMEEQYFYIIFSNLSDLSILSELLDIVNEKDVNQTYLYIFLETISADFYRKALSTLLFTDEITGITNLIGLQGVEINIPITGTESVTETLQLMNEDTEKFNTFFEERKNLQLGNITNQFKNMIKEDQIQAPGHHFGDLSEDEKREIIFNEMHDLTETSILFTTIGNLKTNKKIESMIVNALDKHELPEPDELERIINEEDTSLDADTKEQYDKFVENFKGYIARSKHRLKHRRRKGRRGRR